VFLFPSRPRGEKVPNVGPKLHETGKRYEVSETGTIRNRPSKNGNVGGNAVYIYSFKKNKALYCKKNIMIYINDILEGKPCPY
jgi:hypothetical protein